ncbi:hypothetical protein HBI71_184690 [Parastagonospora nodorum]|nr:hypothetical protein HBI71_184690 [Parastagonospora nodorum]
MWDIILLEHSKAQRMDYGISATDDISDLTPRSSKLTFVLARTLTQPRTRSHTASYVQTCCCCVRSLSSKFGAIRQQGRGNRGAWWASILLEHMQSVVGTWQLLLEPPHYTGKE